MASGSLHQLVLPQRLNRYHTAFPLVEDAFGFKQVFSYFRAAVYDDRRRSKRSQCERTTEALEEEWIARVWIVKVNYVSDASLHVSRTVCRLEQAWRAAHQTTWGLFEYL